MVKAVWERTECDRPASWFKRSAQIEGVWMTLEIYVDIARFLFFFFGVGDHRAMITYFLLEDMIGETIHKVMAPQGRFLK